MELTGWDGLICLVGLVEIDGMDESVELEGVHYSVNE